MENTTMQTQAQTATEQDSVVEQKIRKVRELYADAPELGRVALENGLPNKLEEKW
jgi:hypothetical protein